MLKVRNWGEYNKGLVERGRIFFSFEAGYLNTLYYKGHQSPGGLKVYAPGMYEYILTVKVALRLPWRMAVGFAEGILKKSFPHHKIHVPNYAHASRMCQRLDLKLKQFVPVPSKGLVLAFDSTGVNVYSTSGWHQRKYGKDSLYRKRDQWKKIHLALDLTTDQVMAVSYSGSNVNDCCEIKKLCQHIPHRVASVRADGAYDTQDFYQQIEDWGAIAMIPPARTSKAQDEKIHRPRYLLSHLKQRDATIHRIRQQETFEEGLKAWKKESGYHLRSRIEAFMCRFKRLFGFYLQLRTTSGRTNEIITKMNLLNKMSLLAKPSYLT